MPYTDTTRRKYVCVGSNVDKYECDRGVELKATKVISGKAAPSLRMGGRRSERSQRGRHAVDTPRMTRANCNYQMFNRHVGCSWRRVVIACRHCDAWPASFI